MSKQSQLELAKKCNISNSTLCGYETGYREPNFNTLNKIAEECGFKIKFINKENETLTLENIKRKER